jgi:endogenous inhibitor of DNA gyrase (YacG/DUF329 family)
MISSLSSSRRVQAKCPICGAPSTHAYRPFCSRRCADVDLLRWLKGSYTIADTPADAEEDGLDSRANANANRTYDPAEDDA